MYFKMAVPCSSGTENPYTAKQSVFLRIQVRASNQTKGRERGWKQRARLGRDAKNMVFFVRLARFGRVRLLHHALPISLLILRKKPTVLQSRKPYNLTSSRPIKLRESGFQNKGNFLLVESRTLGFGIRNPQSTVLDCLTGGDLEGPSSCEPGYPVEKIGDLTKLQRWRQLERHRNKNCTNYNIKWPNLNFSRERARQTKRVSIWALK